MSELDPLRVPPRESPWMTAEEAAVYLDYSGSSIRRDALASEGYGNSGYDPLDGDSVSGLIIRKALEMIRGEADGAA